MVHVAPSTHERLLRRPAQEDRRSPPAGRDQERDRPLLRGEPLLGQALRQAGRAGTLPRPDLPPYSPDLNPIEQAFSKVKGLVRKAEARTREALIEAMGRALDAVTDRDARGFFGHCGYRTVDQPL